MGTPIPKNVEPAVALAAVLVATAVIGVTEPATPASVAVLTKQLRAIAQRSERSSFASRAPRHDRDNGRDEKSQVQILLARQVLAL